MILLVSIYAVADPCEDWFNKLNIKVQSDCGETCRTAKIDMSSFNCKKQCDKLCSVEDDFNLLLYYGLTQDEIKYCTQNKLNCLKAYKLSWDAEKICLKIYSKSNNSDESDACRHFIWSILLVKSLNADVAETILNGHENNPNEPDDQKGMDLANNRLGLIEANKAKDLVIFTDDYILNLFKKNLADKKFVILKPLYSKTGGVP